jgi:cytochrome c
MNLATPVILALALWLPGTALAAERGTPIEAKTMMEAAIQHYAKVGRAQALADFNAKKAPFSDRDLYVFCIDKDNVIVANGGFPSLVGQSGDVLKDGEGRPVSSAMWAGVKDKGEAAISYHWFNPVTRKNEPKVSFVRKAGDDICGVGAYDPDAK